MSLASLDFAGTGYVLIGVKVSVGFLGKVNKTELAALISGSEYPRKSGCLSFSVIEVK